MAKKELLFYVMLQLIAFGLAIWLMLCGNVAIGSEQTKDQFNFETNDLEFASKLANQSRQMTLSQIKAKWLELKGMLEGRAMKDQQDSWHAENNQPNNNANRDQAISNLSDIELDPEWGTDFRIFVSSSMSKNLLKAYAKQAKKYGAVLVFNGLPGGSWRKLSELVTEISGNNPELVSIQIDDEAFARFDIKVVPSFVLSKEEDVFAEQPKVTFDKVTGAIGTRRVLELFKEQGQLAEFASDKLEQGRINGVMANVEGVDE